MAWPSARYKTATNGGSWTPTDMNGVQDQYVRSAGVEADDLEQAVTDALGITTTASGHGGAAVRRGKSIIATEESRSNTAYGLMTTPDQVQNIVLPSDGLICVLYHASWKTSVASAGSASIFIGANQLQGGHNSSSGAPQEFNCGSPSTANMYSLLGSGPHGLYAWDGGTNNGFNSPLTAGYSGDATTGQLVGPMTISYQWRDSADGNGGGGSALWSESFRHQGGPCYIFAAAGTYDISVQFKASSGSVTVKERKLWVWTLGF